MASTNVSISTREAMKQVVMTVHVKDMTKTIRLLRLGSIIMRLGAWVAGITYREE